MESRRGDRRVAGAGPPQGQVKREAQGEVEARAEVQDCSSKEAWPASAEARLIRGGMLRKLVACVVALVAIEVLAQVRVPDAWVTDYDYEESLTAYLKRQHDVAVNRKLVPYVYLYADWCQACVALRHRFTTDPEFARVFAGTHIVALDFDSLRSVEDKPAFLAIGAPMIIPIESDGTLGSFAVNGVPWQRVPNYGSNFSARFLPLARYLAQPLIEDVSQGRNRCGTY